jgi:K+-sensing histidine kinase KdpD
MSDRSEHNALLLKVITHDLLSPLTATKWYAELLGQGGIELEKQKEYLAGIAAAANLGISITKHVHVAGKVLTGAYSPETSMFNLTDAIEHAAKDLIAQYERHGVTLTVDIDKEDTERESDKELVGLLMWSVAKYFLSAAPAGASVALRGLRSETADQSTYSVLASLPNVADREERAKSFVTREPSGAYDQAFVFAELIHEAADALGVQVVAGTQDKLLVLETSFA